MPVYLNYQPAQYDNKLFQYFYDDAARLNNVKVFDEIAPEDPDNIDTPWMFKNFTSYSYNQNSQVLSQQLSNITSSGYSYNNRNWITNFDNDADLFDYNLTYFANGNIETQELSGDYKEIMNDKIELVYEYTYDKSNRLLKADQVNSSGFSVRNSYDKDGNILTLKRWDVGGSLEDNFSYQYITGTNKLRRVSGSVDQFYYDGNGNMIADSLNSTYNISYDHRNLIVQLYYKREVEENERMVLRTFSEFYKYDDAGNRIKKVVMKYTGEAQDPTIEDSGDAPPGWNYELIQHYVRDVTGNELAIYNDTTVTFWNVYGIDNAGKINYSDNSWNYYLKDHLGTPRVVIDQNGDIISAEDLDMWGYRMSDRVFDSDSSFYKFTGKERDVTTGYDYFGARYYISQIGRWAAVDTLFEKHYDFSPYVYTLNNPIYYIDPDGKQVGFNKLVTQVITDLAVNFALEKQKSDEYNALSMIQKEQHKISQPDYSSGRVEQTGDEMLVVPIAVGVSKVGSKVVQNVVTKVTTKEVTKQLTKSQLSNIAKYEKQIASHVQKLANYIKDPMKYDNKGFLKNAPNEVVRQKIIQGRVKNLKKQIKNFQKLIQDIKEG